MPKLTRHFPGKNRPKSPRTALGGLVLALTCFGLALALTVRVSAMPVEARTHEVWYSYRQELRYDFTAAVQAGSIYAASRVKADELLRTQLPIQPPVYKRVLLGKLTDSIAMTLPYSFTGDREKNIKLTYWIDGTLTAPGFWQKPFPFLGRQEVTHAGTDLKRDLQVEIPVKKIMADMDTLARELEMRFDPLELRVRPVVNVEVEGLPEPVSASLGPEILIVFRGGETSIEIDEPKSFTDTNTFSSTRVTPVTVPILGKDFSVATLRQVALTALTVFTVLLGAVLLVQWLRRRAHVGEDLKRLGSALIVASGFELPGDVTVVDVHNVNQLINLHLQTDRPVIRVGSKCYLLDGSTCYRLLLVDQERPAG